MEWYCEICNKRSKDPGWQYYHKSTKRHIYIEKYGKEEGLKLYKKWFSDERKKVCKRIKESRTPEEQKQWLLSCRSNTEESYIKKYGKEEGKIKWKERCKKNSEYMTNRNLYDQEYRKKHKYNNSLEGYINKYGEEGTQKWKDVQQTKGKCVRREYFLEDAQVNYDLADWLLSQRQSTFSLEMCIEKYGKERGLEVWQERQDKWLSNFKTQNYSNISQNLFWSIYENIEDKKDIYFAQLNQKSKEKDKSGKNFEYKLNIGSKFIKPDFLIKNKKKIIEFDGDYWHGEKRGNQKRDKERDNAAQKAGYETLRIKEKDYKSDPKKEIQKCMDFINE